MSLVDALYDLMGQKRETVRDTNGNLIEVIDSPSEKVLKFNSIVYSRMRKNSLYTHQYWDFFLPLAHIYKNPRVLMIGLGGGTVAFQLETMLKGKVSMDVVEINATIVDVARKYFPQSGMTRIILGDGAAYVHNNASTYDLLLLDAFVNATVPSQFFTDDFIEGAYYCLKEDGIMAINYLNPPNSEPIMEEFVVKLRRRFNVYRINISMTALNTIIICSKTFDRQAIQERIKESFPFSRENEFILREYEAMKEPQSGSFF